MYTKYKASIGERIFDVFNIVILCIIAFITAYPFIYVLSASVSDIDAVVKREVILFPRGFTLDSYKLVFSNKEVISSYYNTVWYTVVGTLINVVLTTAGAYPLSRKNYSLRSIIMLYIAITMFFSGGLVPYFLLVKNLGLYNTRWAIVIPGAISAWNLVITRVFFQSTIPDELVEAAIIDGANEIIIFARIVLPLSLSIIAVLIVFYGVGHWNDFFGPLIFLTNPKLFPLSLYLRKILVSAARTSQESASIFVDTLQTAALEEKIRYASIVVTILPIVCVYPYLQKYFVKGVMIGALKE